MAYLLRCLYREGGDQARLTIRADHIRHMLAWLPRTIFGSAMFDESSQRAIGMVVALDVDTRAEADAFLAGEAYHRAGLFRTVEVTPLRVMTPPYTLDRLEAELARELAATTPSGKA